MDKKIGFFFRLPENVSKKIVPNEDGSPVSIPVLLIKDPSVPGILDAARECLKSFVGPIKFELDDSVGPIDLPDSFGNLTSTLRDALTDIGAEIVEDSDNPGDTITLKRLQSQEPILCDWDAYGVEAWGMGDDVYISFKKPKKPGKPGKPGYYLTEHEKEDRNVEGLINPNTSTRREDKYKSPPKKRKGPKRDHTISTDRETKVPGEVSDKDLSMRDRSACTQSKVYKDTIKGGTYEDMIKTREDVQDMLKNKRKKTALMHDSLAYASEFKEGTVVTFLGTGNLSAGRVTRVWEGLGVVDVQFPTGNFRIPVEDLQILGMSWITPPKINDAAAGESAAPDRETRSKEEPDGTVHRMDSRHREDQAGTDISDFAKSLKDDNTRGNLSWDRVVTAYLKKGRQ